MGNDFPVVLASIMEQWKGGSGLERRPSQPNDFGLHEQEPQVWIFKINLWFPWEIVLISYFSTDT